MDHNKTFAVLVNFEDHVNVVTLNKNIEESIKTLQSVLNSFDKKLGFANDS
jgi:protein-arginine kinase